MLYIAMQQSFDVGIKMLVDAGADMDLGDSNPLVFAVKHGNRECFSALINGHESKIIEEKEGKFILIHALDNKTTLLPVVAAMVKKESEIKNVPFPPVKLGNKDKKRLERALGFNDLYLPIETIAKEVKMLRSPWRSIEKALIPIQDQFSIPEAPQTIFTQQAQVPVAPQTPNEIPIETPPQPIPEPVQPIPQQEQPVVPQAVSLNQHVENDQQLESEDYEESEQEEVQQKIPQQRPQRIAVLA